MVKKILFLLCMFLFIRSLYFIIKLFSFKVDNLSEFGQGALFGHLIIVTVVGIGGVLLARNIWFKKVK